jgi:hypothetical protein
MIFRAESQAGFKVFYDQLLSSGAQITPIVFTMDSGASIGGSLVNSSYRASN